MKIAKQGWHFILAGVGASFLGALLAAVSPFRALGVLVSLSGLVFGAFAGYFFRDPDRELPEDAHKIYAPGDGVVLSVGREGPGLVVTLRIFLSIFDVHVQRAPCSGTVELVQRHRGSFKAAMKAEARANERVVMRVKPDVREPLVVEQVAGLIARRIECWVRPGQAVRAGQRYGIIYFGSQAAVHFPASARCTARPGDRVVAGETVIGEWIG